VGRLNGAGAAGARGAVRAARAALVLTLLACEPAPSGDGPEPQLVFRLANELTPEGRIWDVSRLFKEELERASPDGRIAAGEIEVVLYDRGMVGTERQLLENTYFGVMEVVQINTAVVTTIDPAYSLFDLPYLFVNDRHHEAVLNGPIGDEMLLRLREHGLVGLGLYGVGFRDMFYKRQGNECVRSPDDLRGLKMRVIESPIMIDAINSMGASATPVPFSELFQALRTGVVDGADNAARLFIASRFYETGANCFTRTEHFTNQHILVANDDWLESLEPRYRERVLEAARAIVPEFNALWDRATEDALIEMQQYGVTVNEVDDKRAFMARVERVSERFLRDYSSVPRHLYHRIRAAGEEVE
jgi:TRAP-type transport system periplasmic protein